MTGGPSACRSCRRLSTPRAAAYCPNPQARQAGRSSRLASARPRRDRDTSNRLSFADPRAAGLSFGVLRDGEASTYHFGHLERGKESPPDDRTVYPIASITKTSTGTLLAQAAVSTNS